MGPRITGCFRIPRNCFMHLFGGEKLDNKKNNKNKKGSFSRLPIGMCIGLAIGAAVGAATHNIGTWLPIGLCLGLVLGYNNKGNSKDDTNDKQ